MERSPNIIQVFRKATSFRINSTPVYDSTNTYVAPDRIQSGVKKT